MAVDLSPEEISRRTAELDAQWEGRGVTCQCGGHGAAGCRQLAEFRVERHLVGECVGPEANQFGNRIDLLCGGCARLLWARAQIAVLQLNAAAARIGGVPMCRTCGAPMVRPSDVVRSVLREPGGVR